MRSNPVKIWNQISLVFPFDRERFLFSARALPKLNYQGKGKGRWVGGPSTPSRWGTWAIPARQMRPLSNLGACSKKRNPPKKIAIITVRNIFRENRRLRSNSLRPFHSTCSPQPASSLDLGFLGPSWVTLRLALFSWGALAVVFSHRLTTTVDGSIFTVWE